MGNFGDVPEMAAKDQDVKALISALRAVLRKHGVMFLTRVFAYVVSPHKEARFKEVFGVKAYTGGKFSSLPANLAGIEPGEHMPLDHKTLWTRGRECVYVTSDPYYITKDKLKELIPYCDKYGINFQIDAEACHFPGHTIRILFKKGEISLYDAHEQTN